MQVLKQQIQAKDPGASVRAKQLGRSANPMLLELAKDPDADVRRITMYCLKETGGPEAVKAFLAALVDEEPQVAAAAVDGLNKLFDPIVAPQLLQTYDKVFDGVVRFEIALLLGRMDKAVDLKELQKKRAAETDPEAQEGCMVALARLGDKPSQEEFVRRLHASKERERRRFLGYVEYIGAPWILKPLLPLLDARENLVHYGVDARPKDSIDLRTCDVVVPIVAKISGKKFTFPINEYARYTDQQLEEVRKFLKGLP